MAGPNGEAVEVNVAQATTNIFSVLGLRMARGRDFTDADGIPVAPPANQNPPNAAPNAAPPAGAGPPPPPPPQKRILSHEFWQRHYGGDPEIVGKIVELGVQRIEVIGVLQPGAELLFRPGTGVDPRPDIWAPFRIDFTQGNRNNVGIRVVGRLKPGVTVAEAQADVDRIATELRARFTTKQTAGLYFHVQPIGEDLVTNVRPALLALMGAVFFVLLIACANVANLLLTRAVARERELAVRSALGASRGVLIRQLLVENLALAGAGAAVGILLAQLGVRLLLAMRPDELPRLDAVSIDPKVHGLRGARDPGVGRRLRTPAGAPVRAARLDRGPSQGRTQRRVGRGRVVAQRRGHLRSRAVVRAPHRRRPHVSQFHGAAANRPGLRSQRRADVPLAEPAAQRGRGSRRVRPRLHRAAQGGAGRPVGDVSRLRCRSTAETPTPGGARWPPRRIPASTGRRPRTSSRPATSRR